MAYKECYVAFIDILGFTNYVENNNFDDVNMVLEFLKVEKNTADSSLKMKYGIPYESINILLVSDSIILSIEKDIKNSFEAIIWMCACFQASLLINSQMLMRGAISCGEFYIKDTILFGKAYLKAYELERKYKTPRIIIDEAIDISKMSDKTYVKKDENDNVLFVDYLNMALKSCGFTYKQTMIEKSIIDNLNVFKYQKEYLKYDWIKDYYNSCTNNEIYLEET